MSDLPESLLLDIISRLHDDLKSVVRCKCVCKLWYSIMSVPNLTPFIKHDASFTLIIQDKGSIGTWLYAHTLPSPGKNNHPFSPPPSSTSRPTRYDLQTYLGFLGVRSVKVEAFFNDLLLVSVANIEYKYLYYICDPINQRFIGVPHSESLGCSFAGLVFDGSRYRIVELVQSRTELGGFEISIYSSESGEWRRYRMGRGGGEIHHLSGLASTLFAYNGKLHCLTQRSFSSTIMVTAIDPFLDPLPESCYYDAEYVVLPSDKDLSPHDLFLPSYTFGVSRGRLQLIVTNHDFVPLTPAASGNGCGAIWVWEIEEDYTACHLTHKLLWKDMLSKNSSTVVECRPRYDRSVLRVLGLHPCNPDVIIIQFCNCILECNIQTLVLEILLPETDFAGVARCFPLVQLWWPTLLQRRY